MRQINHNFLNSRLFIGSILGNGFEATLRSKPTVLSVFKGSFLVFFNFFSDKVELIFWESEVTHQKLVESKFGHRKLLRKWLSSFLELKNKYYGRLK